MTTTYHPTLCGQIVAVTEGLPYATVYSLTDAADVVIRMAIDTEEAMGEAVLAERAGRDPETFLRLGHQFVQEAQQLLAVIQALAPCDVHST